MTPVLLLELILSVLLIMARMGLLLIFPYCFDETDPNCFNNTGTPCDDDDPDCFNETECDDSYDYPNFSNELFISKSLDGGQTWWTPYQATNTNGSPVLTETIDEISAHAGSTADEDGVYILYQIPDYNVNTTDTFGSADYHQNLYIGYVSLTENPTGCTANLGDVNGDGVFDILDVILESSYVLDPVIFGAMIQCSLDVDNDGTVDIADLTHLISLILTDTSNLSRLEQATVTIQTPGPMKKYESASHVHGVVAIDTVGDVAGIQMEVSGDFELQSTLSGDGWTTSYSQDRILIYNTQKLPLSQSVLFSYTGSLEIHSVMMVDWYQNRVTPSVVYQKNMSSKLFSKSRHEDSSKVFTFNSYPKQLGSSAIFELDYTLSRSIGFDIHVISGSKHNLFQEHIYQGQKGSQIGSHRLLVDLTAEMKTVGKEPLTLVVTSKGAVLSRIHLNQRAYSSPTFKQKTPIKRPKSLGGY